MKNIPLLTVDADRIYAIGAGPDDAFKIEVFGDSRGERVAAARAVALAANTHDALVRALREALAALEDSDPVLTSGTAAHQAAQRNIRNTLARLD